MIDVPVWFEGILQESRRNDPGLTRAASSLCVGVGQPDPGA